MKIKTKKIYLLGILSSAFLITWIINIVNGKTIIDTKPDSEQLHTVSLFSLFLGDDDNFALLSTNTWSKVLDILNWLIVGKNHTVNSEHAFIGWWQTNSISSNNASIWWWGENRVYSDNWTIWWWRKNEIWKQDESVWENWIIAWWYWNRAEGWWIILWWKNNQISKNKNWWIILWWENNIAWKNSLVLWSNSIWGEYSFVWNLKSNTESETDYSALIGASGWVLINTYEPIKWVSLVVSWAIKLWKQNYHLDLDEDWKILSNDYQFFNNNYEACKSNFNHSNICKKLDLDWGWEVDFGDYQSKEHILSNNGTMFSSWWVAVDGKWCIQFYDWNTYNTLGKVSEDSGKCGINTWCVFGKTTLNNWDIITGYRVTYAKKCEDVAQTVTCKNWDLYSGNTKITIYPYCYDLSPDPIIDVQSWYQLCTWLPKNAIWINPYFSQNKRNDWNGYTPATKTPVYSADPNVECSFQCEEQYSYKDGKCVAQCQWWEEPSTTSYYIIKSETNPDQPTEWKYISGASAGSLWACEWTCDSQSERVWNACIHTTECPNGYNPNWTSCRTNIECWDGYLPDENGQCQLIWTCKNEWYNFYQYDKNINPSTGFFKINGVIPEYKRYMPLWWQNNNSKWDCVSKEEAEQNPHSCKFACDTGYECGYSREWVYNNNSYDQNNIATCIPEIRCYWDYTYLDRSQSEYWQIIYDWGRNWTVYKNPKQKINKELLWANNAFSFVTIDELNEKKANNVEWCYVACDSKSHPAGEWHWGGLYQTIEWPEVKISPKKAGYCSPNCTDGWVYNGGQTYWWKWWWTWGNRRNRRYVDNDTYNTTVAADTGSKDNSCIWTCNKSTSIPITIKKNTDWTVNITDEKLGEIITDTKFKNHVLENYNTAYIFTCRHKCNTGQIFIMECQNPKKWYKIDLSSYIIYGSGENGEDIKNYTKQYIPKCSEETVFDERTWSCKSTTYLANNKTDYEKMKWHYRIDGENGWCFICSKWFYYDTWTNLCTDCNNLENPNDDICVK